MAKRRAPSRQPTDPLVAVIRAPAARESQQQSDWAREAERATNRAGFSPITYRAYRTRVHTPKGAKKQRLVLTGNDAYRLYRQLHQSPVLVLVLAPAYVSRDPSRADPKLASLLSIHDFVLHKASFRRVREDDHIALAFADFDDWRAGVHCEGEDDPRALPLHMFTTKCSRAALGTTEGNRRFAIHGRPAARTDDAGFSWNRADRGAYHAGPSARIAGKVLEPGMHWEVSRNRGSKRLQNSQEVWRLDRGRTSYANVFPNAHILVPPRSTATKLWPPRGGVK